MRTIRLLGFAAALLILSGTGHGALAQNEIVATVDGETIFQADLDLAERDSPPDPDTPAAERRRYLLELVIQRQVLANAAHKEKFDNDIDFVQRSISMRRTLLQEFYLEKRVQGLVTEADARRLYDEQAATATGEDELLLRHILTEKRETAVALRERIAAGSAFEAVARTVSTDAATASKGGDLGWRTRAELSPEIAAVAFGLPVPGAISEPVQSPDGWHLVMLAGRQARKLPPFEELKADLMEGLSKAKIREILREERGKAVIVYNDPSLKPKDIPAPPPPPAKEQSTEAATAATAPKPDGEVRKQGSIVMLEARDIPATAKVSQWRYGGSLLKLYADGERLMMVVDVPDEDLTGRGWPAGTLIFEGNRRNGVYNGFVPSTSPQNCSLEPFSVSGKAASGGNSFSVSGERPIADSSCQVTDKTPETLVFEYVGPASR